MMIGERSNINPTVHVPPWSAFPDDPTADLTFNLSPDDYNFHLQNEALRALHRYLPSNNLQDVDEEGDEEFKFPDTLEKEMGVRMEASSCDYFRMFEFKVRKCMRSRSHDWTECPYAHPGEKARRRDPRKYHYSGTACPDFRRDSCIKGDSCEFAHGVFECWLHPNRYRTQPCKDGLNCKRRVCFFAHSPDQLRVLSPRAGSIDRFSSSPHRAIFEGPFGKSLHFISSSPESGSPTAESPPMSPMTSSDPIGSLSRSLGSSSVNEVVASLRQLQLNKVKSMPSAWGFQVGGSVVGSPKSSMTRPGFCSVPATPTRAIAGPGVGFFDVWEKGGGCDDEEEEPRMERVESGRDLRAKMFEKLSKENPLYLAGPDPDDAPNPDVEWVSELVK